MVIHLLLKWFWDKGMTEFQGNLASDWAHPALDLLGIDSWKLWKGQKQMLKTKQDRAVQQGERKNIMTIIFSKKQLKKEHSGMVPWDRLLYPCPWEVKWVHWNNAEEFLPIPQLWREMDWRAIITFFSSSAAWMMRSRIVWSGNGCWDE